MRLLRDRRGNTLAMVAAGLIPLLGLIGGGVDLSRIYLTKARLQQACDAGALAGRKAMGGNAWTSNGGRPENQALAMFDANFQDTSYGTENRARGFTENAGLVTGTASVDVPMTIMKVFGYSVKNVAITCEAEMRIPNSDVMFVLDVTGSMGETNPGDSDTKLNGLKKAVKCFYEALAKVDTNADCGSIPDGGNGADVQLRFGFVPYAVNVNVGRLLKHEWMNDEFTYQSRVPLLGLPNMWKTNISKNTTSVTGNRNNFPNSWSADGLPYLLIPDSATCDTKKPADTNDVVSGVEGLPTLQSYTGNSDIYPGTTTTPIDWITFTPMQDTTYRVVFNNGLKTCQVQKKVRTNYFAKYYTVFDHYQYRPVRLNVASIKGTGSYGDASYWNATANVPWDTRGLLKNSTWDGCIEERQTWQNTDGTPSDDYNPIPSSAYDLDIDMVPTTNAATRWSPMLDDVVFNRNNMTDPADQGNSAYWTTAWYEDTRVGATTPGVLSPTYANNRNASCPTVARKLQEYEGTTGATNYQNYVDSLSLSGNTYHDIGLLWGARLMSPTGLFASENATTPEGGEIQRHLIFMTDGDTATDVKNYTPYGTAWWDRRQTATGTTPTSTLITQSVNARMQALCTAVKNKNITLWVISYGRGVSGAAQVALQNCASPGRYYSAANTTSLIDNFRAIADAISQLRLTN